MRRIAPLLFLLAVMVLPLAAAEKKPMTKLPDAAAIHPIEIVRTNDYSEGAVVDREGNIYFSHVKIITKVTPAGRATTWAETGAPNGHKILPNGHHLVCDASRSAVLELDASGKFLKNAAEGVVDGTPLRGPNDLTLDPDGGFYFTDPGGSDIFNPIGSVYYVNGLGRINQVATGLAFPNGIVLTPDRQRLLVGESQRNRILEIKLKSAGVADGPPRVFAYLPVNQKEGAHPVRDNQPDGIALDADGRLWVAHYGMKAVQVLDVNGAHLVTYDGGNVTTSNLCFAGPKFDTLYVTGGTPGALYRLDVKVPGLRILR